MTTNSEALNPSANIFRVVDTKSGKTSTVVRVKAETEFSEPYINTFRSHWVEPAVGRCSCGREVVLSDPLDNECECGACYNMSGQAVIPSRCCDDRGEPIDC